MTGPAIVHDNGMAWRSATLTPTPTPTPRTTEPLHSQLWYHGRIKRIEANNLVRAEGDFLVRDSLSAPGNFVLTGMCRGETLHFEVHRAPSSHPGVDLFYFEDEQFRSIVDLIQFYVTHRRQVTAKSQFVPIRPVINSQQQKALNILSMISFELEPSYAPFIDKSAYLRKRTAITPSLSQQVLRSEASKASGVTTTTFGIEQSEPTTTNTFQGPRMPPPSFAPPQPEPSYREAVEGEDYTYLDYEEMEEPTPEPEPLPAPVQKPQPPVPPPKPARLYKRHSDVLESIEATFSELTRQNSAHSLFAGSMRPEKESPRQIGLDRAQSCSQISPCDDGELRRFPSVKIDPSPLLPARSATCLSAVAVAEAEATCSTGACAGGAGGSSSFDYDDIVKNEVDYDHLVKASDERTPVQGTSAYRPKNLHQVKASSTTSKQMRNLLNFISSLEPVALAFRLTEEDVKVFRLVQGNGPQPLKNLFLADERLLREEVLDRAACIQLLVGLSLQKSQSPQAALKTWVLAAGHLLHKIGNGFAYGAIAAALRSEMPRHQRLFRELDPASSTLLRGLLNVLADFDAGKMPAVLASCFIPYIQPLLALFSKTAYVQATNHVPSLQNFEVLANLCLLARHVLIDNATNLESSLDKVSTNAVGNGQNPLSTESLIHCLLSTPSIGDHKESDRRKIRMLASQLGSPSS